MSSTHSSTLTDGIRVDARPRFQPEHSEPENGRFVYSYSIRITNEGTSTVMLISRHWIIINDDGHREEVNGLGVVGQQPVLAPGESFEYESFCPIDSDFGTMEGSFSFIDEHGDSLEATVGRFYLVAREHLQAGSPC